MKKEWQIVKLKDLTINGKGEYGIGAPAVTYSSDLYTYLRITDITDDGVIDKTSLKSVNHKDASNYLLKENDIVFARTGGSTGRSYFYDKNDGDLVFAGFLIKFSLDPLKLNTKYMKYFTMSDNYKGWVKSFNTGSTRGNINAQTYGNLDVILPSRKQQDLLVGVLSSLDDKIELNNKINQNLEAQAQAIFKSWFVDFEPFKNGTHNYKTKTLDCFCNVFTGKKNANASVENGLHKFFTCSPNPLLIDSFIFDGSAIIISGNGSYTGTTRFYNGKFDLYQRTYACTIKEPFNPTYIYLLYIAVKVLLEPKLMGGTHGSAIPYIVMNDLAKFEILYDEEIFDKVSLLLKPMIEKIQSNNIANESLGKLRDTLLPKLMSGEIDVSEVAV